MEDKKKLFQLVKANYLYFIKIFLVFFTALFVFSVLVSAFVYSFNYKADRQVLVHNEEEVLLFNELLINEHLKLLEDDMEYLSTLKRTADYIKNHYDKRYTPSVIYKSFLERKKIYSDVSIVDSSGKERLRLDYSNEGAVEVSSDRLQDRSESYYFQKLMETDPSAIYFSRFDIGKSTKLPILRIGKVFVDNEGNRQSGIILTYQGSSLFKLIYKTAYYSRGLIYLVNSNGTVISVENFKSNGENVLEKQAVSEILNQLKNMQKGSVINDLGLMSVTPVRLSENPDASSWVLLSFIDKKKLNEYFHNARKKGIVTFIFLISISLIFSAIIAFYRVNRKITQNELLLLRAAFSQSANAIVITDLDGNIKFANKAFEKITGYDLDELIDRNPRALKSGYHDEKFYKELWDTITNGEVWKGIFLNNRKEGGTFWERATITPVKNDKNQVQYYMGVKEDITGSKRIENELKLERERLEIANIELERANRLKSIFLTNISHEIRTPMNAILGFARILFESETDISRTEKLKTIIDSGEHLLMLINDILDFSRIESGKIEITPIKLRIYKIIASVVSLLKVKADAKNLQLIVEKTENVPEVLIGDENRIRQVLINIVSNAIKFTDQGSVVITASWSNGFLIVAVTDSGIGIPQDRLDSIFEPFEQQNSSTHKKYGGTGLGLTISRRYAELMGGELRVSSTLGEGSSFILRLPLKECVNDVSDKVAIGEVKPILDMWMDRMDGNPEMENILRSAIDKLPAQLSKLYFAAVSGDIRHVKEIAHTVKGSTGNLKMLEVYDKIKEIDYLSGEKPPKTETILSLCEELYYFSVRLSNEQSCQKRTPEEIEELEVIDESTESIRILTADDDESNRYIIKAFLKLAGFQTDFAVNGEEVLEKLERTPYDFLFMDIQMPVLDGIETIKRIRGDKKYNGLFVIAVTGNVTEEDKNKYLEMGFNDYISKPVEKDLLLSKLKLKTSSVSNTELRLSEIINELSLSVRIFNPGRITAVAESIEAYPQNTFLVNIAVRLRNIANSFNSDALPKLIEELKEMKNGKR